MYDVRLINNVIDLVNYKFDYIMGISSQQLLLLECVPLLSFLLSTPHVTSVILKSITEAKDVHNEFISIEKETNKELRDLKQEFITMFPELDDTNYDLREITDHNYLFTFRRFDKLLNGEKEGLDTGTPILPPGIYENNSPVKTALGILQGKINAKLTEFGESIPEPFLQYTLRVRNIADGYDFEFRQYVNFRQISLAESFMTLRKIVQEINPKPRKLEKVEDLYNAELSYVFKSRLFNPFRELIYNDNEIDPKLIQSFHQLLNHLRYGIVTGLAENLNHQQVVNKYKTRCMWYDKERVRALLLDDQGNFVSGKEDTLIKEMARYLYDNGYPVLFHVQTENLQTDLMDPSQIYTLLIEGKAYSGAHKQQLVRGIAQLHGYLNNFESAHFYIRDAYFVVFRLSGPIYDFPEEILTNRYRIIPVLIDLGNSTVSGSRQDSQPVIISREEILHEITEPTTVQN